MTISGQEQLMIELVNRARLDPYGEAHLLGMGSDAASMELPNQSSAPLAGNAQLHLAADNHSSWMLATDTFNHTGANGSSAGDRMEQAGYSFYGNFAWGENIGYRGSSGTIDPTSATYNLHSALFASDGHRKNMLNSTFTEIGIGQQTGDYLGYDSVMVTQNFAATGGQVFLTGVVYNDTDNDDFYSVGEGVQGVRFSVGGQAGTSQQAGGYSIQYAGSGWQTVSLSGAGVSMQAQVYFGGDNVKLDLVDGKTLQSSASMTLGNGASNGILLGLSNLNLTGNNEANVLTGNDGNNAVRGLSGNDLIEGLDGNDTLVGGAGNDTIRGGAGSDTATLNVNSNDVQVTQTIDGVVITSSEGQDYFSGIEFFQFNNAIVSLANVLNGSFDAEGQKPAVGVNIIGTSSGEYLRGGTGSDKIEGMDGFDTLLAGLGDDLLVGGAQADHLYGGWGDDSLEGGSGTDVLYGEAGNDTLNSGSEADRLYGGIGDDLLFGGGASGTTVDGLWGEEGNDTLYGEAGYDMLDGGEGNDLLDGGDQADNIYGQSGNDTLRGGQGFDRLFGGDGDDFARGGSEADGLFGGAGNDTLAGEDGNDRFFGEAGNDLIDGGSGDDTMGGGAGFDTLIGGTGNDLLLGNFNADRFVFADGHGDDTIGDFDALNALEQIDLRNVSAIANMFDLLSNHVTQVGVNVVIDTGAGNSITLNDVSLGDLDSSDFLF